jgi:hypothetical protein
MPKLPSGTHFAICEILQEDSTDLNFSALREHILANAKQPSDLYGLLEVVRFAPEEEAAAYRRVDFEIPGVSDVAYSSGMSFLLFLKSLPPADKEEAIRWISERKKQSWIIEKILQHRRLSRAAGLVPPSHGQPPGFLLEPVAIYSPNHFPLNVAAFFGSSSEDWEFYQSDAGFLRLKPVVLAGISGIQGTLALGNPPRPDSLDAWEASKSAGVWDYWEFLKFTTAPDGNGGMNLVFYIAENTFFDRPNEVVATIPWAYDDHEGILDSVDHSDLIKRWEGFLEILSEHGLLGDLHSQQWSIQGEVYDCSSPEE